MRVGFTGSRHGMGAVQENVVHDFLCQLYTGRGMETAHHGDCMGADVAFHNCARSIGWSMIGHPPANNILRAHCEFIYSFPPKEYIIRNHDIVDICDVLIAAPLTYKEESRSGTWATIRYALKVCKYHIIVPREVRNDELQYRKYYEPVK